MPIAPPHRCAEPGCGELIPIDIRYCQTHKKQVQDRYDKNRPSASKRGYTRKWYRLRKLYLGEHPLCKDCFDKGHVESAVEVHHIIPLAAGGTHDDRNLMALCKSCHSKRTMRGE